MPIAIPIPHDTLRQWCDQGMTRRQMIPLAQALLGAPVTYNKMYHWLANAGLRATPAVNRGKAISKAELAKMYQTMTLDQIGDKIGVTGRAVYCRIELRGIPPCGPIRKRCVETTAQKKLFTDMYYCGVSLTDMAAYFKCCHTVINRTAKRLGLERRKISRHSSISIHEFQELLLAEKKKKDAVAVNSHQVKQKQYNRKRLAA